MKIKHKVSGKVIEVMDGTKFAESAYDLVDEKAAKKPKAESTSETKTPAKKSAANKAKSGSKTKKPAAEKAVKTEVEKTEEK